MTRLLAFLPLILSLPGCNQNPASADGSAITSRSDAWEAALNARDVETLVGFYADEARLLPPNDQMLSGLAAVRETFGGMIGAGLGGELTSVEAGVAGDIGYNVGTYTLTAEGTTVDKGKFMEIWRRSDNGEWRITNDIWNSDMPSASAEAGTHLMILHEVEDADHWLAAWRGEDGRRKMFRDHGAAHVHTFRSDDDSNLTGLVIAVRDIDALQTMLRSEEGAAAAAEDGVRMDTLLILGEEQ